MASLVHLLLQTTQGTENFHVILEIGTPILVAFLGYVGLMIRAQLGDIKVEQAEAKAELVMHQNEIKAELEAKHAENTKVLAVHTASDEGHFREIASSLNRGEETMRRIEARQINGVAKQQH